MTFIAELQKTIDDERKRTVCRKCQIKFPDLDISKHICVHFIDSNQFPGLLWQIIILAMSSSEEMKEKILLAKEKREIEKGHDLAEIQLLVDGQEIPIQPFFDEFFSQLNDMVNREAQDKAKETIRNFEEKFTRLFKEAERATTEIFPDYESQDQN